MKRSVTLVLVLVMLFSLVGCEKKYQRINFGSEDLGETLLKYVDGQTQVLNLTKDQFPKEFPVYKITPRSISSSDYEKTLQNLKIEGQRDQFEMEDNKIFLKIVPYTDPVSETFSITDQELEMLAKETFAKLSFIEGEYAYKGIIGEMTGESDATGKSVTRVGVRFNRMLDGVRVAGDDRCDLWFNNNGLVEVYAKVYDYKKEGTMTLVPYDRAVMQIKTPDSFTVKMEGLPSSQQYVAKKLCAEAVELYFINQNSEGCTILQPVYNFKGVITDEQGQGGSFSSKIIAIPEEYTYEKQ